MTQHDENERDECVARPTAEPLAPLFRRMREHGDVTGRERARDQLIAMHMPLVRSLAHRFANRGEPLEDLISTATLALINAVDRFDPDKGTRFTTYATPTIMGELRRYFRDRSWAMKVPRRMQELNRAAAREREVLTQRLGRVPSYVEIADALGVAAELVIEAVDSGRGYEMVSMDALGGGEEGSGDGPGEEDRELANAVRRVEIQQAMAEILTPRERRIVELYFFEERSQSDIALSEQISQMHVSRLLSRAKAKLRRGLQG